jgi:hypothetical protein
MLSPTSSGCFHLSHRLHSPSRSPSRPLGLALALAESSSCALAPSAPCPFAPFQHSRRLFRAPLPLRCFCQHRSIACSPARASHGHSIWGSILEWHVCRGGRSRRSSRRPRPPRRSGYAAQVLRGAWNAGGRRLACTARRTGRPAAVGGLRGEEAVLLSPHLRSRRDSWAVACRRAAAFAARARIGFLAWRRRRSRCTTVIRVGDPSCELFNCLSGRGLLLAVYTVVTGLARQSRGREQSHRHSKNH